MPMVMVGEAWGEAEERARRPFVGPAGFALNTMLHEAGINRHECHLTNVFQLRPRNNDLANLCQAERPPSGTLRLPDAGWLRPEYYRELERLYAELRSLQPNLCVLLGATAAWAVLGQSVISRIRGTVCTSPIIPGLKCLPTYHPAAVLYKGNLRAVTIIDLCKARREAQFPEIRRPQRTVYIEPSLADLEWYHDNFLRPARHITFDIETAGSQITCIGFSPDRYSAIVIPFFDRRAASGSFWPSPDDEIRAWGFVRRVLASDQPKLAQNGLYDIHFLWRGYGMVVNNYADDTMLLHHALQPESEKGLGFLGSVYTDESSWKLMRVRGKTTIKRDE